MKLVPNPKALIRALLFLPLSLSIQAGSITNNFDVSHDYVAQGILGDPNWDGVYLGFGDISGGNDGGDGAGATLVANANLSFPGFLTVQSTATSWAGAGDDGFFLYKMVAGDFDVSVENSPPFDPQNYTFSGLLVRAANYPSGGPFNPSGTNAAENWMNLTRFQEFSIGDSVRYATNGADTEIDYPGDDSDTNSTRYFRISRVGDTFTFYDKTNQADAWSLRTSFTRGDLDGVPMQVGIQQAVFTGNSPQVYFTDFELSGPNVGLGAPPGPPSGLTFPAPNPSGSITLSWTAGAGSAGSLVVMRANKPITGQPAYGFVYAGDTNFAAAASLLGSAGNHVVYVGTGNSVTVSGLGGSNNTYQAAVFSFAGSGSSTVYNTASPATNSAPGPGTLTGVSFTLSPTNIPAGGLAAAKLIASYSSGDSYDVSADPTTIWTSSDPTVIIAQAGVLTGLANGSATITASYAGVHGGQLVSVRAPAYTDNFGANHDYAANGLPGSTWDGLYLGFGDIPGGNDGGDGKGVTTVADANVSANNVLTVTAKSTSWAGAGDDGFLLFKVVPGDFQVAVHMSSLQKVNYQFAGLMARAADPGGAPLGGSENWVNWAEFEEFSDSTEARTAIAGADTEYPMFDGATSDFWLLMTRTDGTNFNFYRRAAATDPWQPQSIGPVVHPAMANGVPLQVGLCEAMFTGASGTGQFDSFMLDASNISGGPPPSAASGLTITLNPDNVSMNLTWVAGTNSDGSQATSMVIMRSGAPVSAQPYFGFLSTADSRFGFGTDLGSGNYVVYRAVGTNVTVTGLTPGRVYYAAVYSYSGSGSTKVFNQQTTAVGSLAAGTLVAISATLPGNGVPMGGVGLPVVQGIYSGGGSGDISSLATLASSDPTVIVATNGVLTGLTNGSATITASYLNFTNTFLATVRPPGFTDNFGVNHVYLADGVTGTSWDGVYEHPGDIPGTVFVSDPFAAVSVADADMTSNNVLTVTSVNVGWEFGQNDGFFLFKYVPGDFQAAVHLNSFDVVNYNNPGLLARAYGLDTHGNLGAAFDNGTNEAWVSWTRFDEFGIGTYARLTLPVNNTTRSTQSDPGDANYWLLFVRHNGTNFSFYQRLNATDPWAPCPADTTYAVARFAGVPMQVGLLAGGFDSGASVTVQFDNFMLDTASEPLLVSTSGDNIILRWLPASGVSLQSTLRLSPPNWQPVLASPVPSGLYTTVTLPMTNATSFFRLAH
ncbi:MAG: hypothetical protein ABSF95_03785 [Verrucomicrobiota bacterium]|jgi:hypothetical protein